MFGFSKVETPVQATLPISNPERRAEAWISDRFRRGEKTRFSEDITITPQIAAEGLKFNINNRPLQKSRVARHVRVMQEGRWKFSTQAIVFAKNRRLIDGQHRLSAIVASGVSVRMTVWFGVEPEEFSVLDIGDTRTAADFLAIDNLPNTAVRAALSAYMVKVSNRQTVAPDKGAIRDMALRLAGPELETALSISSRTAKMMPPTAAALAHYTIAMNSEFSDRLPEFWDLMATGANLPSSSPILKLRDTFGRNEIARIYGPSGSGRTVKIAAGIIFAWNVWVKPKPRRPLSFTWNKFLDLPEVL